MSSRLDRVRDWEALTIECAFQVHALAKKCGVTDRQVERYFQKRFGMTPKAWMDARRVNLATEQIQNGDSVKAVASDLRFKQRSTFSNFFKRHKGTSPTNYASDV